MTSTKIDVFAINSVLMHDLLDFLKQSAIHLPGKTMSDVLVINT